MVVSRQAANKVAANKVAANKVAVNMVAVKAEVSRRVAKKAIKAISRAAAAKVKVKRKLKGNVGRLR